MRLLFVAALAVITGLTVSAQTRPITIAIGTVAPDDTPWFDILNIMGQEWKTASNGKVEVKIYPKGVLGSENAMLKQVRIGQIQGVGLSGIGLSTLAPGVAALQLPMTFDTYADLDRARKGLEPKLEAAMLARGFVVLNWADVGWVHFFTKGPARTPDDLRKLKLFIAADDAESEKLYRGLKFQPVPTPVTDLLTSLRTGLIDAFDVPPLLALSNQSFALANRMNCVAWAPVIGATIIDRTAWERVPADLRPELLRISHAAADTMRAKIRASGDQAIAEMKEHGLTVEPLTSVEIEQWRGIATEAKTKLRGGLVPADAFDEAVRLGASSGTRMAPPANPTGSWTGDWGLNAKTRNRVKIDLKWDGKILSGTIRPNTQRDLALKNTAFDPKTGVVRFEADAPAVSGTPAAHYVVEGKLTVGSALHPLCEPPSIAGTWNPGASRGDFKLTR